MSKEQSLGAGSRVSPSSLFSILKRFIINPVQSGLKTAMRMPFPTLGTIIVLIFVYFAINAEGVAPYPYDADAFTTAYFGDLTRWEEPACAFTVDFSNVIPDTSSDCDHPFGTDILGRDVFSRVIFGTREIFRLAGVGTLFATLVGTTIGLLIGYYGGAIDEVVARLLDSLMSIPVLILALVIIGALGQQEVTLPYPDIGFDHWPRISDYVVEPDDTIALVLAMVYSPIIARVVRSNVLELRTRGFVEAAKLRGESTFYILFREIMPSVIPTLVVEASLRFSYAIFLVASLGYLGLGADPATPNWGLMISEAYENEYELAPWTMIYPAATVAILVISVNLMTDGLKRLVQRA